MTYDGASRGVDFTLSVRDDASSLTVRFTPRGETIRQRALHTRRLDEFCVWPTEENGGGLNPLDMRSARVRTPGSSRLRNNGSEGPARLRVARPHRSDRRLPWRAYVRHAIVAARLVRSRG